MTAIISTGRPEDRDETERIERMKVNADRLRLQERVDIDVEPPRWWSRKCTVTVTASCSRGRLVLPERCAPRDAVATSWRLAAVAQMWLNKTRETS